MTLRRPRIHNEVYPFIAPSKFRGGLQGKVAIITGAVGAIGQAHSECFAVARASLYLTYNRTPPPETLKERYLGLGANTVNFVQCNVGDFESCAKMVKQVVDSAGTVDILINNAGANGLESFHKQDPHGFLHEMAVNFNGPYILMRLVMPIFREQKSGCVVNIASKAGVIQAPYMSGYCASKAAIINLTGCVQKEADLEGLSEIHLYAIHPGAVRSTMVMNKYTEANITDLPPAGSMFRNVTDHYNDSAHLSGMTSVALATGTAKEALKGRYFDVTEDLEDVLSETEAIKKNPLMYGLGTIILSGIDNNQVAKNSLEEPFEFPGF